MVNPPDPWRAHLEALGELIRNRRKVNNLSLRDLAERAKVSNPYLSQIERGLHEPSVRVVAAIARALNVSAEELLAEAGLLERDEQPVGRGASNGRAPSTEDAVRADSRLTDEQKDALLGVYRSYVAANR